MKNNYKLILQGSALFLIISVSLGADSISVGPHEKYRKIEDAVNAAKDGDTVTVQAGTYTESFTVSKKLKLIGKGSVHIIAPKVIPNQKAVIVSRADLTLENIELSGAKVPDKNGAGVRQEKGNLTLTGCRLHNNENGILAGAVQDAELTVRKSEFYLNGHGDGYSHGIYAGKIKKLTVEDSYFHDTKVGHHIKSRALSTEINRNRLDDGKGDASYSIDIPNGGTALIRENTIIQGEKSQNQTMLSYGAEGNLHSPSSILAEKNVFENHLKKGSIAVKNSTSVKAVLKDNVFKNVAKILDGPGTVTPSAETETKPEDRPKPPSPSGEIQIESKGKFKSLQDALNESRDGDTILIPAGTYTDGTYTINKKLTLKGTGGFAHFTAPKLIPNKKAVFIVQSDTVMENIEISGARVPDKNGAGIRYEKGNLTLIKCYIHDNEMGVLSGVIPSGSAYVKDSEFSHNGLDGYSDSRYWGHTLYIGDIKSLKVENSRFNGTIIGHHIKSRARSTEITGSTLDDGTGDASYNIDIPNGGNAVIRNNKMIQGEKSPNRTMVNYGGESDAYPSSSLLIENNTFINRRKQGCTGIFNRTKIKAAVKGNKFENVDKPLEGPGTVQ